VGGESAEVRTWNGTTWGSLPAIPDAAWVRTLHVWNGEVLAGVDSSPVSRAFRWDGSSWQTMGTLDGAVRRFDEVEGDLLALGSFSTAGGAPAEGAARWNGTDWEPYYTGAGSDFVGEVFASTIYENDLMIGGLFYTQYSEDLGFRLGVRGIEGWEPFPVDFPPDISGGMYVLTVYGGRLFVGGTFMLNYLSGMAVLGPYAWESLGFHDALVSMVFAAQEFQGSLYVGGYFTVIDGKASHYIGRYTSPTSALPGDAGSASPGLTAPAPNPFHARTTVSFFLDEPGSVRMDVFDLHGRRVRGVDLGRREAGPQGAGWDGRDDGGQPSTSCASSPGPGARPARWCSSRRNRHPPPAHGIPSQPAMKSKSRGSPARERRKITRAEAQELISDHAKRVGPEDVDKVIGRADELEEKFKNAGPLRKFLEEFRLFVSLLGDWSRRRYPRAPFWTIAAIVVALLYVLNPLDLVPDFIPFVGYVDDATVFVACLAMVRKDVARYRKWQEEGDR
jgi:uncharacterized membrane protein YkvA (DUF1232 family)